jgi:hypothetical protein
MEKKLENIRSLFVQTIAVSNFVVAAGLVYQHDAAVTLVMRCFSAGCRLQATGDGGQECLRNDDIQGGKALKEVSE